MRGNLQVIFPFGQDFFFLRRRAVQSDLAGRSDLVIKQGGGSHHIFI